MLFFIFQKKTTFSSSTNMVKTIYLVVLYTLACSVNLPQYIFENVASGTLVLQCRTEVLLSASN